MWLYYIEFARFFTGMTSDFHDFVPVRFSFGIIFTGKIDITRFQQDFASLEACTGRTP